MRFSKEFFKTFVFVLIIVSILSSHLFYYFQSNIKFKEQLGINEELRRVNDDLYKENQELLKQLESLNEYVKKLETARENKKEAELWEDKNVKSIDGERIKTLFYMLNSISERIKWTEELLTNKKYTKYQIEIIKKEQNYLKDEWWRYKNYLDSLMEKIGEMTSNE